MTGKIAFKKIIRLNKLPYQLFYKKVRSEIKRGIFKLKICKRCRGTLSLKI